MNKLFATLAAGLFATAAMAQTAPAASNAVTPGKPQSTNMVSGSKADAPAATAKSDMAKSKRKAKKGDKAATAQGGTPK